MRRLVGLSLVIIAVAVACGVPGPGALEEIDGQDVPYGLASTTSTSTTTTSTTTTTTIPLPTTTIVPLSTTTTIEQTTSSIAATEPADLYFVSGGGLFRISVSLAEDADARIVLAALLRGPDAYEVGVGLRSAIPEDAGLSVTVVGGVAQVDVPSSLLDELTSEDLQLMFGQVVLTLTSPRCIGQVRFTFGGEPLPVFLGDGFLSEPGQALSCSDYNQLVTTDATTPPTQSPSTSSTSSSSTAPPSVTTTAPPTTGTTITP